MPRHIAPMTPDHPHWPLTYDLDYVHCVIPDSPCKRDGRYEWRTVRAIMLRNHADPFSGWPTETYSVANAETGELIADHEDTKAEANSMARHYLTQEAARTAESIAR